MYRPRLRVKTGCVRCRQQHKKCDETKPTCQACARHRLSCVWSESSHKTSPAPWKILASKVLQQHSPYDEPRLLPATNCTSRAENAAIGHFPSFLKDHFTIFSGSDARDISTAVQMIFSDRCVRESVLVFCSTMVSLVQGREELDREAWSKALVTVRSRLTRPDRNAKDLFGLLVAVLFLGQVETLGPQISDHVDLHTHWSAMTMLIRIFQVKFPGMLSRMPRSFCIAILESALAQTPEHIYIPRRQSFHLLWNEAAVCSTLLRLNPRDEAFLTRSPFLAGQYRLYELVHQVVVLFLSPDVDAIQPHVTSIRSEAREIMLDIKQDFDRAHCGNPEQLGLLIATYDLVCKCVLMCAVIIDRPTEGRDQSFRALVAEALQNFLSIPVADANNVDLIWPVQILACSVTAADDFQTLLHRFEAYEPYLQAGPYRRAQAFFERVEAVRAQPASEREKMLRFVREDESFPRCMLLLRQEGGALSCEF